MKRDHKLKVAMMGLDYSIFLVILCNLSIINCELAQNPPPQKQQQQQQQSNAFQGRSASWGSQSPQSRQYYMPHQHHYHHHPQYPHMAPISSPTAAYSYGHYPNGGRAVEPVKAPVRPLHYHGSYTSPTASYMNGPSIITTSGSSPPAQYSGYYYVPDKYRKPYQAPASQPFYSNPYLPSPSNNLWTPVASPSLSSYHPHAPLTRPAHAGPRYPPVPATSGPVSGANVDTYKEALNLFSEVVQKLEKEPGNGYELRLQQTPRYNYPQSMMSNGIYGSSISSTLTAGGFPHHLDHIMGPEFRQKAQRLYNKIIKEQNDRLSTSPTQQHYHHQYPFHASPHPRPPMYGPRMPQRGHGALSYLEGMINENSYGRPSQYARNMVVDSTSSGSSLVDTVKALEVNIPNGYARNGGGSGEEFMLTSESNMAGQGSLPPQQVEPHNSNHNHITEGFPSPMQFSQSPSPSSIPEMSMNQPLPSDSTSISSEIPRNIPIPLNENDFIEHPLPYEEYEGLIKDIAINHNY